MKKFKIIFLIILSTVIISIKDVKAADCKGVKFYGADGYKVFGWSGYPEEGIYKYELVDSNGNRYTPYCRQPGYPDRWGTTFECVEVVADPSQANGVKKNYGAGIIYILQNGWSVNNKNVAKGLTTAQEISATNTALRLYELLWSNTGQITSNVTGYYGYADNSVGILKFFFNELIVKGYKNKADFRKLVDDAIGKAPTFVSGQQVGYWQSNNDAIQNEIMRLVKGGLSAATKQKTSGNASIKINKKPIINRKKVEIDPETKIKTYVASATYKLEANGFTSKEAKIEPSFECTNCAKYGVSYKILINDKEVSILPDDLVKNYLKNGKGKINITIEFTSTSETYFCEPLDFVLKLKYYDDSMKSTVYTVRPYGYNNNTAQYFYMLYEGGEESVPGEGSEIKVGSGAGFDEIFTGCVPDCDDLKHQCEEGIPDTCEKWEEECSANCNTIVGKAECTDTDTEFDIKEGYEIDPDSCEKSDDKNILKCIINKKDKAGNSYKTNNLIDSQYCTVSCKEDYHFRLPGQKEVNSGRYFTLQAAISGTKSCYTSKIDKDLFKEDLERYRQEVIDAYNVYAEAEAASKGETTFISYNYEGGSVSNNVVNNEDVLEKSNALSAAIKKYENTIKDFNSCSEWSEKMEYNFDPQITFDYEESYMNNLFKDTLDTIGDVEKSEINVQRCSDDTDDSYESCASGWVNDGEISKETIKQFTCSFSPQYEVPVTIECSMKDITINNVTRMKASVNASGKYITPTQFFTIFPTGGVVSKDPNAEDSNDVEGSEPIINGLPVGLGTGQGVYSYYLNVKNLGEFYDTGELGRIWGSDKSVIGAVLSDKEDKCQNPGQLSYDDEIKDGRYVCSYKVNCPDCPVECEPDDCFNPDCPDNNCPVECDGCLYTNGDSNITYRPITPDVLNPNDRDLGVNWQYDDTTINTALELKAYATSKEIEEDGETIYDVDPDTGESATGDVSVKVKLDSKMIKKIQDYNRANEEKGGYASNTLECYDYKDSDGKVYKNIYCYSTFIDGLLESDVGDNIKISGNRLQGNERKNTQNNSNYWTSWDKADSSKWTVTTEYGLEYSNFKKNFGAINIGPSWK